MYARWLALPLCCVALACASPTPEGTPTKSSASDKPTAAGNVVQGEAAKNQPRPKGLEMRSITLTAADDKKVFADHYPLESDKPQPIVLLFHQAGWNAGEYTPIAPRLQAMGFEVLATDQRSGGARDGRENRTVAALGSSTSFLEAYPDLEAALAWAKSTGHTKILVWGSSYSAALVFRLAAEHGSEVTAMLSFSPGEYMGTNGMVAGWAAKASVPMFVTSAPGDEVAAAKAIVEASPSASKEQFVPAEGVHGSSILRGDANAAGAGAAWIEVEKFLERMRST